ncbi:MAG: arsenate reductase ArsC [Planctomycetota bacterium]|nr:arsenate reductase ArsC [Planctomycetota bacterium]
MTRDPVQSSRPEARDDGEPRKRVLFLCTGNSCRSHLAEGLLRHLGGGDFVALSAGSRPTGEVHPLAVEVMRESRVDISLQRSKSVEEFLPPAGEPPDLVISVCASAEKECPAFPGQVRRLHWPVDDPAHAEGSREEVLAVFRRVRDEIRHRLEKALAGGEI